VLVERVLRELIDILSAFKRELEVGFLLQGVVDAEFDYFMFHGDVDEVQLEVAVDHLLVGALQGHDPKNIIGLA